MSDANSSNQDSPEGFIEQGIALLNSGELLAALSLFEQALVIQRHSDDASTLVDVLNTLGVVNRLLSRLVEAEGYYAEALRVGRDRLGPHDCLVAKVLGNLGMLKVLCGDRRSAEAYLQQAVAIYRRAAATERDETLAAAQELLALGDRYAPLLPVQAETAWREALGGASRSRPLRPP